MIFLSNYNAYMGSQKAIQFPVMCDGNITINYSKNIAETPYGIWEHEGDFTMEYIFTPYDINGAGTRTTNNSPAHPDGILTSQKTMPAYKQATYIGHSSGEGAYQSEKYLPLNHRFNWDGTGSNHKMMLFKSQKLELYLENTTKHNDNQPAEYRICCKMTITNPFTLNSPTIIRARDTNYTLTDDIKYLGSIQNMVDTTVSPSSSTQMLFTGDIQFTDSGHKQLVHEQMELFDANGVFMGTIKNITNFNFTIDTTVSGYTKAQYDATDGKIYKKPLLEAPYLEGLYHLALSFDDATGKISLFLNNVEIASATHTDRLSPNFIKTNFTFGTDNIFIGKDASLSYPEDRKTQFMGEIHEMAITNSYYSDFSSLYTLLPQHRNLLLYLTFEEED